MSLFKKDVLSPRNGAANSSTPSETSCTAQAPASAPGLKIILRSIHGTGITWPDKVFLRESGSGVG